MARRGGVRARLLRALISALLVTVSFGEVQAASPSAQPTLILYDGDVYTPTGWQHAVAVEGDKIVAVGSDADILATRVPATVVVDLRGKALLPGLHDSHSHPPFAGAKQRECQLDETSDMAGLSAAISACVKRARPGEWITGGGWGMSHLKAAPDRKILDTIAPDNPVALIDSSYHSRWVNSRALALAGITRQTQPPKGGVIVRDDAGDPTGIVSEEANDLIVAKIPPATQQQIIGDLHWALGTMLENGITSLTDAWIESDVFAAYRAIDRAGTLDQRVIGCRRYQKGMKLSYEDQLASGTRFSADCLKIFLDGVPLTPRTASVLVPYVGMEKDPEHAYGLLLLTPPQLEEVLGQADRMGLRVKMHAAGDGAVREAVDAVVAVRRKNGNLGKIHSIAHVGWIGEGDTEKARAAGVALEFSPYVWFPSPGTQVARTVVGDARMAGWYPVRKALDDGDIVIAGSDWPVVPSVNPWLAMETLVTRKAPGNVGDALSPANAVTLKEAFDMFTVNAAVAEGRRQMLGAIEVGLLADLIVTDQNPFKVAIGDVHKTKVTSVYIGGRAIPLPAARR